MPSTDCLENEFPCDVTRCIPMDERCDSKIDCTDETDEQNCPAQPSIPPPDIPSPDRNGK